MQWLIEESFLRATRDKINWWYCSFGASSAVSVCLLILFNARGLVPATVLFLIIISARWAYVSWSVSDALSSFLKDLERDIHVHDSKYRDTYKNFSSVHKDLIKRLNERSLLKMFFKGRWDKNWL